MDQGEPSWRLIAVLYSTMFLSPALTLHLYRTAVELHRADAEVEKVDCERATGTLRALRRELLLGTFGGPGFEAELETPRGRAVVRFIVTREGIELAELEAARREAERLAWN